MEAEVLNYNFRGPSKRIIARDAAGHEYVIEVRAITLDVPQVNLNQLVYDIAEDLSRG